MSPQEGMITTRDNVRLFYRKIGTGSSVVLIPNGLYYFDEFKQFAEDRTLVFYDVRNRGRSETISDSTKLAGGLQNDVEDLEAVRTYFGIDKVDLIGHSYIGLMIALYGMKYPQHINRMIQISPSPPDAAKQYPPELAYVDSVITNVLSKLANAERSNDPLLNCEQFWKVLGPMNVYDSSLANKIDWGRCKQENERNFMTYWSERIFPSVQDVHLSAEKPWLMKSPVLIIHGKKDRSAPYGGALDWASYWPNARILSLENVAHAPWIERPDAVFPAIRDFLAGAWPSNSQSR